MNLHPVLFKVRQARPALCNIRRPLVHAMAWVLGTMQECLRRLADLCKKWWATMAMSFAGARATSAGQERPPRMSYMMSLARMMLGSSSPLPRVC